MIVLSKSLVTPRGSYVKREEDVIIMFLHVAAARGGSAAPAVARCTLWTEIASFSAIPLRPSPAEMPTSL